MDNLSLELLVTELELADAEGELAAAEQQVVTKGYLDGRKEQIQQAEERVRFLETERQRLYELISELPECYGSW